MDKKKILSSLALAGILTASVLGSNVNATNEEEYLKPVGVYKKLIEGKNVVPYILRKANDPVTVKDIQSEFTKLELVNETTITDMNATIRTGDTFRANGIDYTVVIYGDVNKDGKISAKDATLIQKIALKKETNVDDVQKEAADVNNNGKITAKDALAIQKYVLKKETFVMDELPPIEDVTKPVLNGVNDGEKRTINLNDTEFTLPKVTAIDDYDGEIDVIISGEVNVTEEGEYPIVYTATDRAGNKATATLTVVVDNQAPIISGVEDGQKIYVKLNNNEFVLPEVIATDAVDGEIKVSKTGTFDVTEEGEYQIEYTATDSLNHVATATVTIVVDGTPPKAKVEYSTTVVTKEDVTVTIISDELLNVPTGWEALEDGKSIKKVYTQNVKDEKLRVSDKAGNETEVNITIANIDKEVKASPSYSVTTPTNGIVTATIISDEPLQEVQGWTLASDKMSMIKDYDHNIIENVIVKDILGNQKTITIHIQNIDKVAPKAGVQYSITELTREDVEVTITANEELQSVVGNEAWQLKEGDATKAIATFTANGTDQVTITDKAGNETVIPVTVSNIDKDKPELTVEYNITTLTNQNVIVTIRANEKLQPLEGWTIAEDGLSMAREYQKNISEDIMVKDLIGNEEKVTIMIANIDKDKPVIEGFIEGKTSYKKVTPKFTEKVATLQKDNEEAQIYESETEITTDGKYVLIVTDEAGNIETKEFTIDNVAPVFPMLENKLLKKGDRLDTNVVAMDAVDGEIPASLMITFQGNEVTDIDTTGEQDGEYMLTYTATDEAGNTAITSRKVTVDANKATYKMELDNTDKTTEVIVRISFNEKMQLPEGNEWKAVDDNQVVFIKKYIQNTIETVEFKDMAGNITEVNIAINNIDSDAPSYFVDYSPNEFTNGSVIVTIRALEELQPVEGWDLLEDKMSITKTYTENKTEAVIIKDLAGNIANVPVNVNQIDKENPEGKVTYSKTEPTKEEVIVTITSKEELKTVEGWKLAKDGMSITKTYTENGTETVTIEDLAGNTTDVLVEVSNIDKKGPVVEGVENGKSYQEVTPQFTDLNGPITATLQKGIEEPTEFIEGATIEEEGTYKLIVKDSLDNETIILFTIDRTITINNVEDGKRYTSVTPTFEGTGLLNKVDSEDESIIISSKIHASGVSITEDGTYKLTATDAAGNTQTVTFVIDNVGPRIEGVEENKTYITSVTPTVITNGTIKEVVLTKNTVKVEGYTTALGEITDEGVYELSVTDDLGITKKVKFTIDKTAPTVSGVEANGEYQVATPVFTEEGATATLQKGTEEPSEFISNTLIAADGDYTLVVTDKFGNSITIPFKIDNVKPEIRGVENNKTYKQAVTPVNVAGDVATILLTKDGSQKEDYTALTEIDEDGEYELTVADKAGNETIVKFTIDTEVKEVSYTTSNKEQPKQGEIIVTIRAGEKLREIDGWTLLPDALSMVKAYDTNKTEEVTVYDLVGNEKTITIVVKGIDNEAPKAEAPSYSKTTPTNQPVTVTIVVSEPIQEVKNWKLAEDPETHKLTLTRVFTDNGNDSLVLKDIAGNIIENPIEVEVNNIYATAPKIEGIYEEKEKSFPQGTGIVELPKNVKAIDAKGAEIQVNTSIKQEISEVDIKDVSEINLAIPGKYTIIYTAEDVAGNKIEETRIIYVI